MDDSFKHEVLLEVLGLLPSWWELRGAFICSYAKRGQYPNRIAVCIKLWVSVDQFRMRVVKQVGRDYAVDYRKIQISDPDAVETSVEVLNDWSQQLGGYETES